MPFHSARFLILAIVVAAGGPLHVVEAQEGRQPKRNALSADGYDDARREILDSKRWRKAVRQFDEWLSVQTLYGPDQVAAIRADLEEKVADMSPRELERFLVDMEDRLEVLLSPEAEEARDWLSQFMAVARNPEQQLGRNLPDVRNMTASQIRQEIRWLEQHRAQRQQEHAAFNRARSTASQAARDIRTARQSARPATDRSNWPANTPRPRPERPQRELLPQPPGPVYMIGPWGAPYFRMTPPPHTFR